jgi:hypothetical protein
MDFHTGSTALRRVSTIRRRNCSVSSGTNAQESVSSNESQPLCAVDSKAPLELQRQQSFETFDDVQLPVESSLSNPDEVDEVISFLRFTNVDPNLQTLSWIRTIKRSTRARRSRVGLMDLPVEIRCQIYHLVLPELIRYRCKPLGPHNLPAPCPPAITRASRDIRIESFELWCTTVRLPIRFRATSWIGSPMGIQGTPTYELVCAAHEFVFPYIRKLQLCFDNGRLNNLVNWDGLLCFSIDLDKKHNSYSVEHTPRSEPEWPNSKPLREKVDARGGRRIQLLLKHFNNAMAEILVESGGVGHITLEHYQRLLPQPWWRFWADMSDGGED